MSILHDPSVWTGWALDPWTAHELAAHLDRTQPRTVVEAGSGASTILLAEYAARTGARIVALEHHPTHAALTADSLHERGLADFVDLRRANLVQHNTAAGTFRWYDTELPDRVDFALVDGPPGTVGRGAALFALWPSLTGDWTVWVDDGARDGERAAVKAWERHMPITTRTVDLPKGLTVITDARPATVKLVDAADVAVTLVTGGRPDLLNATLGHLERNAPGLLDSAYFAVLHNGGDHETERILDVYDELIDHRTTLDRQLPIGDTAAAMLGTQLPRPYVLHLEDDWVAATAAPGWLDRARQALDDPRIGQIRLRHRGDTVLTKHMITRKVIDWQPGPDGHLTGVAHYTLNPSLMRSADTPRVWDTADGETPAMRRFYNTGLFTAQAVPGVFRHVGDGHSLRLGQR